MKKAYALSAALLLILCMAGCVGEVTPEPENIPIPESVEVFEELPQEHEIPAPPPVSFSIAQRADELVHFLSSRPSRAAVEKELGVVPARAPWVPDGDTFWYRFDLAAVSGYEFISGFDEPDFEGMRAGYVEIIVFLDYTDEDRLRIFNVWYVGDGGVHHFNHNWYESKFIEWHRIFPELPISAERKAEVALRAEEISDFLQIGLSRDAVEKELAVIPARVLPANGGGRTFGLGYWYRFDLMTAPDYEFTSEFDSIDIEGLLAGYVGIIVFVTYDSEDMVDSFSLQYVVANGINQVGSQWRSRILPWYRIIPR